MLPTTIDRFETSLAWKKVKIPEEAIQTHFLSWPCSVIYDKTGSQHLGSTHLGSSTTCNLFTKLGSFRLPLIWMDRSRTYRAALWFVRRCKKMARRMVCSKKGPLLLGGYSQVTRKMWKMYNKRWNILWIKHFLSFFRI